MRPSVLIVGLGVGSTGSEICKCLKLANSYTLYGADRSSRAWGLFDPALTGVFPIGPQDKTTPFTDTDYVAELLDICIKNHIQVIASGADGVHRILDKNRSVFIDHHILLMLNDPEVISLCSHKAQSISFLERAGISVPYTQVINSVQDVLDFPVYPCIVKPNSASGASSFVFLAESVDELLLFWGYLATRGMSVCAQEYIDSSDEFTVCVASAPTEEVLGSVAVKRLLESKLSTLLRTQNRVISSGWSQGLICSFPEVQETCVQIARVIRSRWALNIQGRWKDGVFYPFEINPRHSGTCYLRALAGCNVPHALLQHILAHGSVPLTVTQPGLYLRGFTEKFIPITDV